MSDRGETTPTAPRESGSPAVPRPPLPPYAAAVAAAAPARTPQPPGLADSESTTEVFATALYPTDAYPTAVYPRPPQKSPPQPPDGYGAPMTGYAPPHAYVPPSGFAAPPQGYGPYLPVAPAAHTAVGSGLGVVAFLLAVLAAVGGTILGSVAAYRIGLGTGRDVAQRPLDIDFDWSILAPVREWVLVGEVAFWAGTVMGIWALVQGIVAIVTNRGRGWAVAAVVIAVLGPIAFATGVQGFLVAGFASGAIGS